ncbi:MAG: hypothetical protein U0X39_01730 [Bacteroidales bacterium]
MNLKKIIAAILLSTIWISISEFARNQFFFKALWTDHYSKLGLTFPGKPVNGAVWGIWALMFSLSVYFISRKFSFLQTALLSWLNGFILMWLVIGNLSVLPHGLLIYAVPLSMIEVLVSVWIILKIDKPGSLE